MMKFNESVVTEAVRAYFRDSPLVAYSNGNVWVHPEMVARVKDQLNAVVNETVDGLFCDAGEAVETVETED